MARRTLGVFVDKSYSIRTAAPTTTVGNSRLVSSKQAGRDWGGKTCCLLLPVLAAEHRISGSAGSWGGRTKAWRHGKSGHC